MAAFPAPPQDNPPIVDLTKIGMLQEERKGGVGPDNRFDLPRSDQSWIMCLAPYGYRGLAVVERRGHVEVFDKRVRPTGLFMVSETFDTPLSLLSMNQS